MKKKLLLGTITLLSVLMLAACGATDRQVNVSTEESLSPMSTLQLGKFIDIGDDLSYDSITKVVYLKNYTYYGNYVYVPYYAANGKPYKYNVETNTLEEITEENVKEDVDSEVLE